MCTSRPSGGRAEAVRAFPSKQTVVLPGALTADVDISASHPTLPAWSLGTETVAPDGRVVKAPIDG